jgi:hypothetical protein
MSTSPSILTKRIAAQLHEWKRKEEARKQKMRELQLLEEEREERMHKPFTWGDMQHITGYAGRLDVRIIIRLIPGVICSISLDMRGGLM